MLDTEQNWVLEVLNHTRLFSPQSRIVSKSFDSCVRSDLLFSYDSTPDGDFCIWNNRTFGLRQHCYNFCIGIFIFSSNSLYKGILNYFLIFRETDKTVNVLKCNQCICLSQNILVLLNSPGILSCAFSFLLIFSFWLGQQTTGNGPLYPHSFVILLSCMNKLYSGGHDRMSKQMPFFPSFKVHSEFSEIRIK